MIEQLNQFEQESLAKLNALNDSESLKAWKGEVFGKTSLLSTALGELGQVAKRRTPARRQTSQRDQTEVDGGV